MYVRLIGTFQVLDGAGRDCTPRGAKARALLAVLCQTPDRRRARRWLEAKLWSDRGPEQASGSLRQALMEVRKALGPAAENLTANRDFVLLHQTTTDIETERETVEHSLKGGREFLEGIDVVDPAFLDWLREERLRLAEQFGLSAPVFRPMAHGAEVEQRPPFVLRLGSLPDGMGGFIARDLAQAIARLVAEFSYVDVYGVDGTSVPEDLSDDGLTLHIEGALIQGRVHLMVSLIGRASRQTVWSQRLSVGSVEDVVEGTGDVPAVVFEAAHAALMQMPRLAGTEPGIPLRVNALIAQAVTAMFSYDGERLAEADRLLEEAAEMMPSDRLCAWRSLVRQIMFVERTRPAPTVLQNEADAFARAALEMSSGTALVLALVSLTRIMVDENPEAGAVLARDAVRLSPFNPFAHWAEAAARSRNGLNDLALVSARRGIEIASRSPFVHSWEALAGLVALRGGDKIGAIAHYEAAHSRSPNYRAAMRPLAYLYLDAGAPEKAARVLKALLRAEPDFTPALLRRDDYPAHTLQLSGLAEKYEAELGRLWSEITGESLVR